MNAKVDEQNPDLVTITVDGVEMQVPKGSMIIEATDAADIDVPRFCYHKKLSIAASCRMCLVETEIGGRPAPKPMPACATPVADGMKVFTNSPKALAAQRGVMEFLLINHPLDCPVCDQGGECELQDLAMGYGRSVSRFTEGKRIFDDENLGPLIDSEMTRCIHCTRCVRFLQEVGGQKELAGIGRGEHTMITTYVREGIKSELSGNVIDLCPVGALVSKPFHYRARAWELLSHAAIAPHDSVGSNLWLHHRRGEVMRSVPRENESINEVWISDRDRFSYTAMYSEERLQRPLIKRDGQWAEVDWEEALTFAVSGLRRVLEADGGEALGTLVSPTATLEEMHLLVKLVRGLGSDNIDHRLRRGDFRDGERAPMLGLPIAALENLDKALVIGSDLRSELPMLNHRLRKASLKGGQVSFLNPREFELNFDAMQLAAAPQRLVRELALVAQAVADASGKALPDAVNALAGGESASEEHHVLASRLVGGERAAVLVGALAEAHPDGSVLRALAAVIAELAGATYGDLPSAANSVGGWIAGTLPRQGGLNARAMLEQPRKAYVLFNVEPEDDCWNSAAATAAVESADFVVALTPFVSDRAKAYADVLLPIGTFGETSGTYVNLEGRWQSFGGIAAPVGEARPAWRVLRVLGNLFALEGFDYEESGEVLAELPKAALESERPAWQDVALELQDEGLVRVAGAPIYAVDALVRRSQPLQDMPQSAPAAVHVGSAVAEALGLAEGEQARVRQGRAEVVLPVVVDDAVPAGTVWIPAALAGARGLGAMVGGITVERA